MDYEDPQANSISIAVRRHVTAGESAPILLLNPGGPGGSGTDMVTWAPYLFSEQLRSQYNLVGFDPRGVQQSDSVECLSDSELDAYLALDLDMSTETGRAAAAENAAILAEQCTMNTGDLLGFVDSDSVVRDMDIVRAVVGGREQLDYFGFSYGTYLGALYADVFPERVGRFVLDAAMDPSLSLNDVAMGQAMGFDRAVRSYMDACLEGECWFKGSAAEGLDAISALFDTTRAAPLPTGEPARPLTRSLALTGVLTALYSPLYWLQLSSALDLAINAGDGSGLLALADIGNSRNPDGTFDGNATEAFMAINCLDYPLEGTESDWQAAASEMAALYPVFGDALAYSEVTCAAWPYSATGERTAVTAAGSEPILVVGTTRDPATPYEWAVSLADQLDNGHLLTYEGDGHAAFGNSRCVNDAVEEFILAGRVPEEGATC